MLEVLWIAFKLMLLGGALGVVLFSLVVGFNKLKVKNGESN